MKRHDWEAWEQEEPSPGFAARVVAGAVGERTRGQRAPARRALAGFLLIATLAAAVALVLHLRRLDAHGDVTADARREVHVGARAVAVLEKGAHVMWSGDDVLQDAGDVFWRVEPGARFVVRTPEGEVTVKGTCFRVRVLAGVAAGVVAVSVIVYEGKVGVSHAGTSVDVVAGETVQSDPAGVHRASSMSDDGLAAKNDSAHAVASLDRARADRMREQIRAFLAEAGPIPAAVTPDPEPTAPVASGYPTMPLMPDASPGEARVDPSYIQKRVREDLFPLARDCYSDALKRDPKAAGTVAVFFRIIGDRKVGGVVDEAHLTEATTLDDPEMQTCVRESMMSLTFDAPPNDGEITVVYPIVFSPEDDDAGSGH